MKLTYNELIYNEFNHIELGKLLSRNLLWSSAEIFRKPIQYDSYGNYIDGTGTNLASFFKLHYDVLMTYLYIMVTEMKFSYTDFNTMPFFEIEMLIDIHKERVEEQNKQSQNDNSKIEKQMASMQKQFKNNSNYQPPKMDMPKMPNFNNMNIPKF